MPRLVVAVALAMFALARTLALPAMLVGVPAPALLVFFALQAVGAILAAVGVWRARRWAPAAVVALGVVVAATSLYEGFVLGIIPYLQVLLVVVAALVLALAAAGVTMRTTANIRVS